MFKLSNQLVEQRKTQKPSADYLKKDDLKSFKQANAYPIHMSTNPGILDLDIDSTNESYIVSGARDGQAIVFDLNK